MTSISFSALAAALLLCIASACAEEQGVQFGYGNNPSGPNKWGSLNPHYTKCSSGKTQSPVDITKKQTSYNRKLGSLVRDYHPANATLVNHISNVAMFYDKGAGAMAIQGKNYTLKQMHWHTPSEHQINGDRYAAELQLVHQAEDGGLAVVATLFKSGDEDPFLSDIQEKLKELAKETCGKDKIAQVAVGEIDTKYIERKTRKYYRYVGSLTTPPCTENVIWTILGKVRSVSKEQVELLEAPLDKAYKANARPVQALNGRKVEMFHELADKKDDDKEDKKD